MLPNFMKRLVETELNALSCLLAANDATMSLTMAVSYTHLTLPTTPYV